VRSMTLKQWIILTVSRWLEGLRPRRQYWISPTGLDIKLPPGTRLVAHGPVTYVTAQIAGDGSRYAEFNNRPGWVIFVPDA